MGMVWRHLLFVLCLATTAAVSAAIPAAAEPPWKTVGQKHGLLLEKREVTGSTMPMVRVTTHSPLPAWRIASAIWADRSTSPFVQRSRRKRVVLRETPDERVVHEQMGSSVVSDRDYVVRLRRSGDGRLVPFRLTFELDNGAGPPPAKGVVRLTMLRGSWTVTPTPDGGADVVYVVHSEPGGSIPAFLVRGALVDAGRDLVVDVLSWAAAHP